MNDPIVNTPEYIAALSERCLSLPWREKKRYMFVRGSQEMFSEMLKRCCKWTEFQKIRAHLATTDEMKQYPQEDVVNLCYARGLTLYGWYEGWTPEGAAGKLEVILNENVYAGTKFGELDPKKWQEYVRATKTIDTVTPWPPLIPSVTTTEHHKAKLAVHKPNEVVDLDRDILWAVKMLGITEARVRPKDAPSGTAMKIYLSYRDNPKWLIEQAIRINDETKKRESEAAESNADWKDDRRKQMSVIEKLQQALSG